jgi:hypothetical protein
MITVKNIYTWISEDLTNSYYFLYLALVDGSQEVVECQSFEELESSIEDLLNHNSAFGY